ncbi:MAG: hypothetical protein A3F89_01090 [Deltaproteobacteria bacterium RIFCSPLOWO2_12_FULL_50_11]|nr:MAG: hypothetical protein A2053_01495 [Deltaproteobacteria bacterium GWA2_50_8]OGQ30335.1 MAG: hypothetical protein A3B79_01065 [Deltaproteobacteria bacterium RIFCSPHIGHO2_02_FULL_50_15]OGQ66734.1 MAG: hypothetical protein A3F89_01090 [Deltaproteobacteria bacterium RIFCSPLOWO2_12_FULL_50_11]
MAVVVGKSWPPPLRGLLHYKEGLYMSRWVIAGMVLLVCLFPQEGRGAFSEKKLIDQLQETYRGTQSFQADFVQKTEVTLLEKTIEKRGTMLFAKPDQFVIHYKSSPERKYISDGHSLWIYDVAEKEMQVIQDVRQALEREALAFLGGLGELLKTFRVPSVKGVDSSYEYVLIPRLSSSSMEKIILLVHQETFWVEGITLYPKGGNVSHYQLKNQKMNIKTSPDLFHPKTPPGVRLQIF